VMFLNQSGWASVNTHPAHAHKHAALQPVPNNHRSVTEKPP
jgi:hypothetical protein